MSQPLNYEAGKDCYISPMAEIEEGVVIGSRTVIDGNSITIKSNTRIETGCIISGSVTIGLNALVRAGSVVLHDVPANAIVQGNPAQVVGYRQDSRSGDTSEPRLIDVNHYENNNGRPALVSLGVGNCSLHLMRRLSDTRGSLSVGEVQRELPFPPERYFAVYDVPSVELRGEHAHKQCEQFLLCLHGSCRILLDDGTNRCEVILDRPDVGVYMPSMIWGTQYRYTRDAVLFVFASQVYDPGDYIRDYDEFKIQKSSHELD